MAKPKQQWSLCLVMIVKNESKVIYRCLDSIRDYLDYWVIYDTGSDKDNTPKMIEDYFAKYKIPGELHRTEWKNFGYNRTQAVQTAKNKADFLILMDADFICHVKDPLMKTKPLTADAYMIKYEGPLAYRQNLFVKGSLLWRYVGVTHEYIHCTTAKHVEYGDFLTFTHPADGGCRSDKFERDIRLLQQGLIDEPNNIRYMFYLAQSYKDIQEWTKAIEWYQKRVAAGGWAEEVYYALYQIGLCKMRRGDEFYQFMGDMVRAFMFRPVRLEALFHLIHYCYRQKDKGLSVIGYQLGKMGMNTETPTDLLFVEKPVHDYLFLDALSICAVNCGKYKQACQISQRILAEQRFPEPERQRLENNQKVFKLQYMKYLQTIKGQDPKTLKRQPRWKLHNPTDPNLSVGGMAPTERIPEVTTQAISNVTKAPQVIPNVIKQPTSETTTSVNGVQIQSLTIRKKPIWISLTTIPSRLARLTKTLESLKKQTLKPTRINLCVPERCIKEDQTYQIPAEIADDPAITIIHCQQDWGPATKLLGSLVICDDPETRIIVVDDDIIYPPDLVEKLVARSNQYPESAIGFCGWQVRDVAKGRDHFYRNLVYEDRRPGLDFVTSVDVLEGYRGVLTKARFWDQKAVLDYSQAPKQAFYVDDSWLSGHLARRGIDRLAFKYNQETTLSANDAYGKIWVANHVGGKDQNNSLSTRADFVEANQVTAKHFWDDNGQVRSSTVSIETSHFDHALIDIPEANDLKEVVIRSQLKQQYHSAIIIPVYQRPEYLQWTLKTLVSSHLPEDCLLIFVDDASDNTTSSEISGKPLPTVRQLLDQMNGTSVICLYKKHNRGVFHSLRLGLQLALKFQVERLCLLDSDTILRADWFTRLCDFYNKNNSEILLSGFNLGNRDHHRILKLHEGANLRQSIGGVNMYFSAKLARAFLPLITDLRWDYNVCLWCNQNKVPILTLKPSVVQHLGIKGMFSNPERSDFDFAYDFYLETVTSSSNDAGYYWLPCVDSPGNNLEQVYEPGVASIRFEASRKPEVVAWDMSGWLKIRVEPPNKWQIKDINEHLGLFIKSEAYRKLGLTEDTVENTPIQAVEKAPTKQNRIVLLVEDYRPENSVRREELQTVLHRNLENPLFDQIVLFSQFNDGHPEHPKMRVIPQLQRLTYQTCLEWINQNLVDTICVVANADIYFDQSLERLNTIEFHKLFISLLRYDVTDQTGSNQLFSRGQHPHADAQDTWIFKAPFKHPAGLDFYFGKAGCDNRLAYEALKRGYNVLNCPYDIKSYHYHLSDHRTYDKADPVLGPFLNIYPSSLEDTTVKGNYQNYYHFWGLEGTEYAGWGQKQLLDTVMNKPTTSSAFPSCLATLATYNSYQDLKLLITSLRIFEPDIELYVLCDSRVKAQLATDQLDKNTMCHVTLDKYSHLNRNQMEKQGIWLEFMLKKIDIIDIALRAYSDVLFLDSDILLLDRLPTVDKSKDIGLSPHLMKLDLEQKYGRFNGGFIWVNHPEFTKWWLETSQINGEYFEQKCLEKAVDKFKTMEFTALDNFGWWRCLYADDSAARIQKFQINHDGYLVYDNQRLRSIHTHFFNPNLAEMATFSQIIIKQLQKTTNPIYDKIKTLIF